LVLANGR